MALDADNVRSALTGAVYTAAKGTTAPTDPTTAFGVGWVDLGYVNEDGVTESNSDDWNEVKAWQNRTIVRRLLSSSEETFKFMLLETTAAALTLYHAGSAITGSGPWTMEVVQPTENRKAFGIDVIDGSIHTRILVPDGQVTDRGDIVYKNGDAYGYEMTITAYPDSAGVVAIKMSDDTAWGA